jgi:hypothetical protein
MLQVIVPLPLKSLFWQQAVEQKLDAFGCFVVCAGLTAASFFSAFCGTAFYLHSNLERSVILTDS